MLIAQSNENTCNAISLPTPVSEAQQFANNLYIDIAISIFAAYAASCLVYQFAQIYEILNSPLNIKLVKLKMKEVHKAEMEKLEYNLIKEQKERLKYYIQSSEIFREKANLELIDSVLKELIRKCSESDKDYYNEILKLGYLDKMIEIDFIRRSYCISPTSMSKLAIKYCEQERKILKSKVKV